MRQADTEAILALCLAFIRQMTTTPNTIVFRLVGTNTDGGKVRLHQFGEFCKAVEKLLLATEECITDSNAPHVQYRIADMQCQSAMFMLEAIPPKKGKDRRKEILSTVRATFKNLQSGKPPDPRLSPKAINAYRNFAKPIQKSIGKTIDAQQVIHVDGIELTSAFIVNIDNLSRKTVRSMGQFSGELEQINLHNKSEFVVYPKIGTFRIVCNFPDSLLETVRAGIKRHVTVNGWMHYAKGSPFPVRADVMGITIHETVDKLPLLAAMAGKLDLRGDSVSLVRAIRDE